jgi:hypothetical protein
MVYTNRGQKMPLVLTGLPPLQFPDYPVMTFRGTQKDPNHDERTETK